MLKHLTALKSVGLILLSAFILGGCAVGQKYEYSNVSIPLTQVSSNSSAGVGVQDARSYVVSGDKAETFVGLQRGLYNNPFNVNTQSGSPLAMDMRNDIVKAMQEKGMTVVPVAISPSDSKDKVKSILMATQARKLVLVTINEWKSNIGWQGAELMYDVTLTVMNSKGNQLAMNRISGKENLGSYGTPHAAGVAVTEAFSRKFNALFDNSKIIAALK